MVKLYVSSSTKEKGIVMHSSKKIDQFKGPDNGYLSNLIQFHARFHVQYLTYLKVSCWHLVLAGTDVSHQAFDFFLFFSLNFGLLI